MVGDVSGGIVNDGPYSPGAPALRRPGRFDREIEIGVPNTQARLQILKIHSRAMPLGADVDLQEIAEHSHGFVGADLEALCQEVGMIALRRFLSSTWLPSPSAALDRPAPNASDDAADLAALEITRSTATEVEYWPVPDPSAVEGTRDVRLDAYRRLRDQLLARLKVRFGAPSGPSV